MPVYGLLLALATPPALAAQSVNLRLGGFRTFYAESLDVTAGSMSADAAWSSRRARLGLSGSVATFESDGWAAQGAASWANVLVSGRGSGAFVTADANGYGFDGGTWAGISSVGLLGATPLGSSIATLAAAVGGVRRLDGTDDVLTQATLRLRRERGVLAFDAWGSASRAGSQSYGDLAAGIRAEWYAFALDLTGGSRFGDLGDVAWAQARAALRLVGPGWLEVSAGRYPPDVTGFQQGTFVQAGLKVSLGRPAPVSSLPESPAVTIVRQSDGAVVLTVAVEGRRPVAIAGDWNAWTPIRLRSAGSGQWRVRLTLEPGIHRFTLIDRAGAAFVPEGVASEPDDFGSMTGLLNVPRP